MSFFQNSNSGNEPTRRSPNILRILLFTTVPLLILLLRFCIETPCEKVLRDLVPPLKYKDGAKGGLTSESDYIALSDSTILDENKLKESSTISEFSRKFVEDAMNKVAKHFDINEELLFSFQNEAYEKNELINTKEHLDKIFTVNQEISDVKLEVNDVCALEYKINLYYPHDIKDVLPSEIDYFLRETLKGCSQFESLRQKAINNKIDLAGLLRCLKSQEYSLKNLMRKYKGLFEVVDFGLPWLKKGKSIRFERGEFSISGIDQLLIDEISKEFARAIREAPNKSYKIICYGYTDTTPVKSIIKYNKKGKFSEEKTPISLISSDLDSNYIGPYIKNNNQLSYARAFSGIDYFRSRFSLVNDKRYRVRFQYQGSGADIDKIKEIDKRRIEFILKLDEPKD